MLIKLSEYVAVDPITVRSVEAISDMRARGGHGYDFPDLGTSRVSVCHGIDGKTFSMIEVPSDQVVPTIDKIVKQVNDSLRGESC